MIARSTGTGQLIVVSALTDPVFGEISALASEKLTSARLTPTDQARGAGGAASPRTWEHTGDHVKREIPAPATSGG